MAKSREKIVYVQYEEEGEVMNNLTPRAKFIKEACTSDTAAKAWDAMQLASTHDPDHAKLLRDLIIRVENLEHYLGRTVDLLEVVVKYLVETQH